MAQFKKQKIFQNADIFLMAIVSRTLVSLFLTVDYLHLFTKTHFSYQCLHFFIHESILGRWSNKGWDRVGLYLLKLVLWGLNEYVLRKRTPYALLLKIHFYQKLYKVVLENNICMLHSIKTV